MSQKLGVKYSDVSRDEPCTDDKCGVDDSCGKMSVWCWPVGPKNYLGPCKFSKDNFWRIPTGSLYFASRKGPLSAMNARVTGSPYDLVGIIVQSKTENKEGTYVYTVDTTFVTGSKPHNKILVINLDTLVNDNNIIYHAVLPLKDFDDGGVQPDDFPKDHRIGENHGNRQPHAAKALQRWARKFDESCNSSTSTSRICSEKGFHHSKYDSDSDCSDSEHSDCTNDCGSYSSADGCFDSKSWCNKLRMKRNEVLRDLLFKYKDMEPEHDAYQVLASIVGLPVAESLRSKNAFTSPEVIGLILFQAGLIWDDHFATGNRNPVCCFDQCFFSEIIKSAANAHGKSAEVEAVITLTTPKAYVDSKLSTSCLTSPQTRSSTNTTIPSADCRSKSKESKKSKKTKKSKDETDSSDESEQEEQDEQEHKNPKEDRKEVQEQLDKSVVQGTTDAPKIAQTEEEKEKGFYDYYGCDDESSYKRCFSSSKWYNSSSSSCSEPWPKPCEKCISARTIFFGSLRPVDFLIDYYRATGIDPNGHVNLQSVKPLTGQRGEAGELVAMIHSLAAQRAHGDLLDYDINKLNMSCYHDNLIPVELCNDSFDDCCERIDMECLYLRKLVCQIDQEFTQKRMLHTDNAGFTGSRLLNICRRTSGMAAELHCLAGELDTYVVRCGSGQWRHIRDCSDDDQYNGDASECHFKLRVDSSCSDRCASDYLIVLNKYMWSSGWEFHWKKPHCCKPEDYYHLICRTQKLLADLLDLKNRTPVTCIVLELIVQLLEQTRRLYTYLCRSRRYCCGSDRSGSGSYRDRKGDEMSKKILEGSVPEESEASESSDEDE